VQFDKEASQTRGRCGASNARFARLAQILSLRNIGLLRMTNNSK